MVFVKEMPNLLHRLSNEKHEGLPEEFSDRPSHRRECIGSRLGGRDRHLHDIGRLRSLGALNDIKFDVFALLQ